MIGNFDMSPDVIPEKIIKQKPNIINKLDSIIEPTLESTLKKVDSNNQFIKFDESDELDKAHIQLSNLYNINNICVYYLYYINNIQLYNINNIYNNYITFKNMENKLYKIKNNLMSYKFEFNLEYIKDIDVCSINIKDNIYVTNDIEKNIIIKSNEIDIMMYLLSFKQFKEFNNYNIYELTVSGQYKKIKRKYYPEGVLNTTKYKKNCCDCIFFNICTSINK